MNVEFPQFLKILQTSLEYHSLHVSPNSRPPVASPVLHCCKMHQGELARSPSLAQAEMIQRLNPVAATTRPRPPKLTPASASASLQHDDNGGAEAERSSQRRGREDSCRSKTSKVIPDHSQQKGRDDDTLRKCCEETTAAADPALVKAAAARGTAQILETLRAREGLKWDFEDQIHKGSACQISHHN